MSREALTLNYVILSESLKHSESLELGGSEDPMQWGRAECLVRCLACSRPSRGLMASGWALGSWRPRERLSVLFAPTDAAHP